jgi:CPA2 family monovalent cation:H+ antiporter-2
MHTLAPLIYDLAIMLGLASIVVLLFQRIHQPVVLGYLIAGMIVGPYIPPHALVNDMPNIRILSELGVIFLMFSLGLEFSFRKLIRVGFSASITGLLEVVLMLALGYGLGRLLGWNHYNSLFLGAALSISSTTIIIKAIDELHLKTKRFAELIFGVLIIEDLLAILLLVALSTLVATEHVFSFDMLQATIKLVLVVGGWFLFGYFLVPPLFRQVAHYISQETLVIVVVALCLFLACLAAQLHYSTALGAFIMGSILAETVLIRRIEILIVPIRDIFAAVFFISMGMLINPTVIIQQWPIVLGLSLATIFGKIITTTLGAFLSGQSLNTSVRAGFSMAQIGEFSFIIVALGASLQVINDQLYSIIVAVSAVTTFTTPYLIRFSEYLSNDIDKRLPKQIKYFLNSYSAWVYRIQMTSEKSIFRGVIASLLINGIMVAIIFVLLDQYLLPKFLFFSIDTPVTTTVSLLIALIVSSPFIWGMLYSFRKVNLPEYAKTRVNPVMFMSWLVTLTEITVLTLVYFHIWLTVSIVAMVGIIFFAFSYKQLEKSYYWFEEQLVNNIQTKVHDDHAKYEELAPWDTHLVEIEVSEQSPLQGKTLAECDIRHKYGINIVAILHGSRMIPSPRGEDQIMAHDRLIVLGNDEQIDEFRNQAKESAAHVQPGHVLDHFALRALLVRNHPELVGKTIRHSQLREQAHGLVVGLERDNVRILNPDPEMVLKEEDLLLLVGEVESINKVIKK